MAKGYESSFLRFFETGASPSGKTRVWSVRSVYGGADLGVVKWHAPWRRYCFFPGPALFEEDCLRDIADFVEERTMRHKEARDRSSSGNDQATGKK